METLIKRLVELSTPVVDAILSERDEEMQDFLFKKLIKVLQSAHEKVQEDRRITHANFTQAKRIQPTDEAYGVHMSHCYGENWEDPGTKFSCKYGEDDICPAAAFENPWKAYLKWKEQQEIDDGKLHEGSIQEEQTGEVQPFGGNTRYR